MSILGAAAIGAGATLLQGVGNIIAGKNNRNHAEKLWWKQQAYNHPAKQIQRLNEAGINPHLAFAKGSISNTASSQAQSANIEPPQMLQYFNMQNLMAQNELIRAQAKKTNAEAKVAESTIDYNIDRSRYETLTASEKSYQEQLFSIQETYGLREATTPVKHLFMQLRNEYQKKSSDGEYYITKSEQERIRNIVGTAVLGQELKSWLGKIGFGFLFTSKNKK
jgi:hypothetical protein